MKFVGKIEIFNDENEKIGCIDGSQIVRIDFSEEHRDRHMIDADEYKVELGK